MSQWSSNQQSCNDCLRLKLNKEICMFAATTLTVKVLLFVLNLCKRCLFLFVWKTQLMWLSTCNFIGLQFLKCVTWRSLLQSYTAQKMKYSVFGHIYWRNPEWKTSFCVQCYGHVRNISSIFDVWANFPFTNSERKLDC